MTTLKTHRNVKPEVLKEARVTLEKSVQGVSIFRNNQAFLRVAVIPMQTIHI